MVNLRDEEAYNGGVGRDGRHGGDGRDVWLDVVKEEEGSGSAVKGSDTFDAVAGVLSGASALGQGTVNGIAVPQGGCTVISSTAHADDGDIAHASAAANTTQNLPQNAPRGHLPASASVPRATLTPASPPQPLHRLLPTCTITCLIFDEFHHSKGASPYAQLLEYIQ